MHIIIGVGAAIALLYFWLIGHWFARVLVFPLLGDVLGLGGAALFSLVYSRRCCRSGSPGGSTPCNLAHSNAAKAAPTPCRSRTVSFR